MSASWGGYEVEFLETGAQMFLSDEEIAAVRPCPVEEEPPFVRPDETARVS